MVCENCKKKKKKKKKKLKGRGGNLLNWSKKGNISEVIFYVISNNHFLVFPAEMGDGSYISSNMVGMIE